MAQAILTISRQALKANYEELDALSASNVTTGAVVKADGYGLGAGAVAQSFWAAGAREFFVASAEEARALKPSLPTAAKIYVFAGLMAQDCAAFQHEDYIPILNSPAQIKRYISQPNQKAFGIELDTGMNRLGIEEEELSTCLEMLGPREPEIVISHLACADDPDHPQNQMQLATFKRMTEGRNWRRSLAATGGVLLGKDYHFDLTRPGIGLYGGAPFEKATPVIRLSVPVIQTRRVRPGEAVGYGASWVAKRESDIATISVGYADGFHRAIGSGLGYAFAEGQKIPIIGRVSMDMITLDVTDLRAPPQYVELIGAEQKIDRLAALGNTIGYEILTSLGRRYQREYL